MWNKTPVPEPSPDLVTPDPLRSCQVILMPSWPAMKPENTWGDRKHASIKRLEPMYNWTCFYFEGLYKSKLEHPDHRRLDSLLLAFKLHRTEMTHLLEHKFQASDVFKWA